MPPIHRVMLKLHQHIFFYVQVGHNTALALAKHSDKLQILDVSWCREMSNDLLGYFVDNCSSLKVLKVFGCTQVRNLKTRKPSSSSQRNRQNLKKKPIFSLLQVTDVFVKGHSNPNVKILGLKMNPFLGHLTKNLADS